MSDEPVVHHDDEEEVETRAGFAPGDITDGRDFVEVAGRRVLRWQSAYDDEFAARRIRWEAGYLLVLLLVGVAGTLLLHFSAGQEALGITAEQYKDFRDYSYLALGGLVGGVVFGMKWHYHVVAKGIWHQDRIWWRLFVPILSAVLAFAFGILARSGLVAVFDAGAIESETAWGFAFLVGYFSDSASAKLAEVATTLFGSAERHRGHAHRSNDN